MGRRRSFERTDFSAPPWSAQTAPAVVPTKWKTDEEQAMRADWIIRRSLPLVMATALALCGCDQKPSAEKAGRDIDQTVTKAGERIKEAAGVAERKIDETVKMASEKTGITADSVNDAALTARVKAALIAESGTNALDVNVESKDGVVSLYGKADSGEQRERAAKVAGGVNGVKSVSNHLAIADR
jgi:hyperosmotically inducible protein